MFEKKHSLCFLQDTMDNRVPMMRLNPVTDGSNRVEGGLLCNNMDEYQCVCPQQITLGVLFIMLQASLILGYFGKG
jgi:hypothetical protein